MLTSAASKAVFNGNGVVTRFPFGFRVWEVSQISVTVAGPDGVSLPASGWTAELTANGGTVSYAPGGKALPEGWKLAILRDMPFVQRVQLRNGTSFNPEVIETQMDQATAERQQLLEDVQRSIKVPPTSDDPPELLAELIFAARDEAVASAGSAALSAEAAQQALESTLVAGEEALGALRSERADSLSDIIFEGDRQVVRVAGTGDTWLNRMAGEADRASREADRAEEAASAIPGLAENRTVFQGYRVEGVNFVRYTPEAISESTNMGDYDAYDVLPVLSGWRIDINGHLVLESGFSA